MSNEWGFLAKTVMRDSQNLKLACPKKEDDNDDDDDERGGGGRGYH